jgi:hypothetical protein
MMARWVEIGLAHDRELAGEFVEAGSYGTGRGRGVHPRFPCWNKPATRRLRTGAGRQAQGAGCHVAQARGLIEAIDDGLRAPGLQTKLDDLEQRKHTLEADIAAAPPPLPRFHPNIAEAYRRNVEALQQALAEPDMRTEALDQLRGLIERIIVVPTDAGLEIELLGEIAHMMRLSAGAESLIHEPFASSMKVVARSRNHRQYEVSVTV